MTDFDPDELIHGLWNRHRARLPRFAAAHREKVLAAVADALAAEPAPKSSQTARLVLAAVAAAVVVALPWWLAVVSLPPLARAATAETAAVTPAARAEAVGVPLAAENRSQLATVARPHRSDAVRQASGRAVLRSIDVHTLLDAPTFIPGETF